MINQRVVIKNRSSKLKKEGGELNWINSWQVRRESLQSWPMRSSINLLASSHWSPLVKRREWPKENVWNWKKKKKKRGEESRSSYWREAVENKWVIRNEGAGLSSLWNSVAFMNSNQRFKVLMCTDVVRSLRLKKKLMKGMWWCMLERRRSDDLLYDSGLSRRGEWERWREWVRMEKWKLRTGLVMMIWVWSSQYPR